MALPDEFRIFRLALWVATILCLHHAAVLMPMTVYGLAVILFVSSLFGSPVTPTAGQRLWWGLILLGGAVLIETALYLSGMPLGADYIQGTQGRYFIPFLPLGGLALLMPARFGRFPLALSVKPFTILGIILVLAGLAVALDSFWIDWFTLYPGMSPIARTFGGIVRLLLLPLGSW